MKLADIRLKLFSILRIRQDVAGLEISDAGIRFVSLRQGVWQTSSLRLPPGIISGGQIIDHVQFRQAVATLRDSVFKLIGKHQQVNVTVCIGSTNIYSQIFNLPILKGESLDKAIQLNLQMVSPTQVSETYAGWQVVGEDKKALKYDILSSFISRSLANELVDSLNGLGFWVYALEPRSVALARLVRNSESGLNENKPAIILDVSDDGLELVILRGGQPYFSYFVSWKEIQGESREMPITAFQAAIVRSINQVLNFYSSHWSEPLDDIYLIATALKDEINSVVRSNFTMKMHDVVFSAADATITSDLYVPAGSALRSKTDPKEDKEVSLLGISVREDYIQHQVMHFLAFWQLLVPLLLGVIVILLMGTDIIIRHVAADIKEGAGTIGSAQSGDLATLRDRASKFNETVSHLSNLQNSSRPKSEMMKSLNGIIQANSVQLLGLSLDEQQISLLGQANSEEDILKFKQAIEKDGRFNKVSLPLSEIKPVSPQGESFSMSFSINSWNTP